MKITIKKIAQLAEVSRGTVDRVINERPGVRPEVRKRVNKIIKELGYRPNMAGKALAYSNKPIVFGIIMPPEEIDFFDEVRKGIKTASKEIRDLGIRLEYRYVSNRRPEETVNAIYELEKEGISGLMISTMESVSIKEAINEIVENNIPVVTFNSDILGSKRICFVGQDLYKSGQIAASLMQKVLKDEKKVIAVTGNLNYQAHKDRIDGFLDKIKKLDDGIEVVDVIEGFDNYKETYNALDKAFSQQIIGGVYMATGSIEACLDLLKKHEIGKNVHVICNDLVSGVKKGLREGVLDFTISQDPFMQGYRPLRILYEYVFLGKKPASEIIFTDNRIIMFENMD